MLLHPVVPIGAIRSVESAIAARCRITPFGDEYGKSAVHRVFRILALVINRMAMFILTRIVVERIGDVPVINRICKGRIRVLVVVRGSHHDKVVRILADRLENGPRIGSDAVHPIGPRPACIHPRVAAGILRLVVDFKNHVVIAAPPLGHVAKELLGLAGITLRTMAMVVDNHVDVVIDSGLDHRIHQALVVIHFREVVAIAPVLVDTHGSADNLNFLVLY